MASHHRTAESETIGTRARLARSEIDGVIQDRPVTNDRIVAIGLLTARDVDVLGVGFRRLYPVDEVPCFADLLRAIDDADRDLKNEMPRQA